MALPFQTYIQKRWKLEMLLAGAARLPTSGQDFQGLSGLNLGSTEEIEDTSLNTYAYLLNTTTHNELQLQNGRFPQVVFHITLLCLSVFLWFRLNCLD